MSCCVHGHQWHEKMVDLAGAADQLTCFNAQFHEQSACRDRVTIARFSSNYAEA